MTADHRVELLAAHMVREGAEPRIARNTATHHLHRFQSAGLTVMDCTIHQFIERAGLTVFDPKDEATVAAVCNTIAEHVVHDDLPTLTKRIFDTLKGKS